MLGELIVKKQKYNSSNKIYKKNINALRRRYPKIYQDIQKTSLENYIIEELMPQYLPNLFSKKHNNYYYNNQDPLKDVEGQLNALQLKNAQIAVFLGFGLGYEIMYYGQSLSYKLKTSHVLIIERDLEIFKAALMVNDFSNLILDEKVEFIVGAQNDEIFHLLLDYTKNKNRFIYIKAIKSVYHISSIQFNKDYYLHVLRELKEVVSYLLNYYGNAPHDSLLGIENMLDNLKEIIGNPGINLLYNKFKNKPAVIVSTGPSLNKNKHLLKELQEKALIICPDASLKVLLKMGVKPHLVTSLERTSGILKLIQGIESEDVQDVFFAACPVIERKVYESYPGPRIIVYRNFDHFKWLEIDRGMLDIKMSSGNMAFKLAQALGCNPIILIGQDLAFGIGGETHAGGSIHDGNSEIKQRLVNRGTLKVKGNYEEEVLTSKVWYNFLKGYEEDIASYQGLCINSTEGGAYIAGTELMSFQEAIEKYIQEPFDPLERIKLSLSNFTEEQSDKDYIRILKKTEKAIEELEEMVESCIQGQELVSKYKECLKECLTNQEELDGIKSSLPTIEREVLQYKKLLSEGKESFQLLVMHYIQSYIVNFEIKMKGIPDECENDSIALILIILSHEEYYKKVGGLIKILLDALIKAEGEITTFSKGVSQDV